MRAQKLSLGGIPRLDAPVGLEHELWSALVLVSSRSGSDARAVVVPRLKLVLYSGLTFV
jgi:hypothetical protein